MTGSAPCSKNGRKIKLKKGEAHDVFVTRSSGMGEHGEGISLAEARQGKVERVYVCGKARLIKSSVLMKFVAFKTERQSLAALRSNILI